MNFTEIRRLSKDLGRMLVGALWVALAGIAGALGAAHAHVLL